MTEANIQDYISNIVSKYLQVGLPPWQICVIPIVKSVPLARSDEAAAEPSTSADRDVTSGNDAIEDEQQQTQPIPNEQTTVRNQLQNAIQYSCTFINCMVLNSLLSHPYTHTHTHRARKSLIE